MTEVKEDLKREKVRIVEISKIKDFPNHPFLVKDDESTPFFYSKNRKEMVHMIVVN